MTDDLGRSSQCPAHVRTWAVTGDSHLILGAHGVDYSILSSPGLVSHAAVFKVHPGLFSLGSGVTIVRALFPNVPVFNLEHHHAGLSVLAQQGSSH